MLIAWASVAHPAGILERCGIVGPESGRVGVARVDAEGLEQLLRRVVELRPRVRPVRLPESLGEDRADQVGGAVGVGEGLTWRAHRPVFQSEGDGVAIRRIASPMREGVKSSSGSRPTSSSAVVA